MRRVLLYIIISVTLLSCDGFLEVKPRKGLVVPESLDHLNGLLLKENESLMDPMWGEISTDDYSLMTNDLDSKDEQFRNAYLWSDHEVFPSERVQDWLFHYRFIYYANTVLEKLADIKPSAAEQSDWTRLRGEALFYRGKFHYDIAIIWADAYTKSGASQALGIPLRLHTNFNEVSVRPTLEQTYRQILSDIEASILDLPDISSHATRPSKTAARALAARIYLSMGDYEKARQHAEEVLAKQNELMDYNDLSSTASYTMPVFNKEVILHAYMQTSMRGIGINPILYDSYGIGDLRKNLFFREASGGLLDFVGSYYNRSTLFSGLAVDEMYLIAAECNARLKQEEKSKTQVLFLLKHRYTPATVPNLSNLLGDDLIDFILQERRKELVFRGLRWGDVKRLNKTGANISLERVNEGSSTFLPPNSPKFNLSFPQDVINLTGMPQNPR